MSDMREAFERTYKSIFKGHHMDRDPNGDYVNIAAYAAWRVYQAARAQGDAEPVGEIAFDLNLTGPSAVYAVLDDDCVARLAPGTKLYAAPPAAPDVSGKASPTPFESAINRVREASASIQNAVDEWDDHIARTERSSPLLQAVNGGLLAHLRSVILGAHSAYQGADSPENKHLMGQCMEALVEAIPDIDAALSAHREQQGGGQPVTHWMPLSKQPEQEGSGDE